MIKKIENCLYCDKKMESKTAKKKFCSDRCKVYWNREKKAAKGTFQVKDENKPTTTVKNLTESKPKSNYTINTEIPPMPIRNKGEDVFDFAARKNEWKTRHNQP